MLKKENMKKVENVENEEQKLLEKVKSTLSSIEQSIRAEISDLDTAVNVLRDIRTSAYENINQLQHATLILRALKWLSKNKKYENAKWFWHPFQTGGTNEPDLLAKVGERIILSAEITTSEKPIGTIDKRMSKTLNKLGGLKGELYYFVQTKSMENRAITKTGKIEKKITVINLSKKK